MFSASAALCWADILGSIACGWRCHQCQRLTSMVGKVESVEEVREDEERRPWRNKVYLYFQRHGTERLYMTQRAKPT